MSTLSAPGARLYYETHGSGPLMLMIAGASGSGDPFKRAADYLAARLTVVIYDRRGFSRSELDGPQDYTHRLQVDADDVRRLIEHLSDKPATAFGPAREPSSPWKSSVVIPPQFTGSLSTSRQP
jgi:pimeloyl-ACP methyl ester carboxylesterase